MQALVLTTTIITVLIGTLIILKFTVFESMESHAVRIRTRKPKKDTESSAEAATQASVILLLCKSFGQSMLRMLPYLADKRTIILLQHANYRTPDHLAIFIGIKGIVASACMLLGIINAAQNPTIIFCGLALAILGWVLPNFFLASRAKARQNQILKELPTVIDLLIVCAQAGLGMIMCIDKVSKEISDTCPVLSAEFKQLINDVKVFAKSTTVALTELSDRCGVDAITSMTGSLIASESKGSDMSYSLRQQSDALRDKVKRKKEEEAGTVTVKMVPIIMIFILPLIMCPLLGPAAIAIMQTLSKLGK